MKYYTNETERVFAFDDGEIAPEGYTEITEEQADKLIAKEKAREAIEDAKKVPFTVSRFQLMSALSLHRGPDGRPLYEIIEDYLEEELEETEASILIQTAWSTLPEFTRDSKLVSMIQEALKLSDNFIDDIFRKAGKLQI